MRHTLVDVFVLFSVLIGSACTDGIYNDGFIQYAPVKLSEADKQILLENLKTMDGKYDPEGKMITKEIIAWNYHTDAMSGKFHEVRASFGYAVALLDCGLKEYEQRAFDVIDKTISLQDTNPQSPSCGVWPYYEEEPLATKKSPIDYNWADFNAVSLLDIYMGHKDRLPQELLKKVEGALILAAKAVQKRDCGPGYTNIAIMGTYVTYVTSHFFNLSEMQEYAAKRLKTFYDYTQEKGGFSEYNSPTYTIVAIDELNRMQRHIVEPEAKRMIDELYDRCWDMIARHYHKKSAQWTGPHSRSYRTLVASSFYGILKEASGGKIDLGYDPERADVKTKHHIPESLLPYFLTPQYPRTEIDVFEKNEPQIVGTSYMADNYALSGVSRSSMWNQRRPLTAYWGELNNSHYLQVRLLHDFYDFSTASIFTRQKENKVLAAINFGTNGGDKHISIDRLKDGKFRASDLRLRFELGNCKHAEIDIPEKEYDAFFVTAENCRMVIRLLDGKFDRLKGYWEKGHDQENYWVDYVLYSGDERDFDLIQIDQAVLAFALSLGNLDDHLSIENATSRISNGMLKASWEELAVEVPVKPDKNPANL